MSDAAVPANLPPERDFELVVAAQHDPGRREELIDAFCPLIASVACVYRRAGAWDAQELMQQGVLGLLRAPERYDPRLATPFWAYASWWVRQAMQRIASERWGPVVLSDCAQRTCCDHAPRGTPTCRSTIGSRRDPISQRSPIWMSAMSRASWPPALGLGHLTST